LALGAGRVMLSRGRGCGHSPWTMKSGDHSQELSSVGQIALEFWGKAGLYRKKGGITKSMEPKDLTAMKSILPQTRGGKKRKMGVRRKKTKRPKAGQALRPRLGIKGSQKQPASSECPDPPSPRDKKGRKKFGPGPD